MKKAFTLIELLIVITIIGILAALIFINLSSARKKAQNVQIKSDMAAMSKALEIAKIDGTIQPVLAKAVNDNANDWSNINKWLDIAGKKFIQRLPKQPLKNTYYYIKISSGGDYGLITPLAISEVDGAKYWCIKDGQAFGINDTWGNAVATCLP